MDQIDLACHPELIRGAVRVVPRGQAWYLARMTAALEKHYSDPPFLLIRAVCMAGVHLALQTDASEIRIGLQYARSCRPFSQSDVFIDGQPADPIAPPPDATDYHATALLPGGALHTVEIYLPHCREVFISQLAITKGAVISTIPRPHTRWLALGDSITQGMSATSPTLTWTTHVARRLGWDLHNLGVGGAVAQAALGRLALDLPWDVATVAFGVNDFNNDRPLNEVQTETRKLLEGLLQRPQAAIYLLTPVPWVGRTEPNKLNLHLEDYRQALRQAAAGLPQVTVIEGTELLEDREDLFYDKVHPNNAGMAQIAENITAHLLRANKS